MVAPMDPESLRAIQPLLEAEEYDSYSWLLLEDHPLRSYPEDCPTGVFSWTQRHDTIPKKRWRERLAPIICLLLMFFVVVQFLSQLPRFATYLLQPVSDRELPDFIQWSTVQTQESVCIPDNLQPVDVIEHAFKDACTGIKVDLWLCNRDLLVGGSSAGLDENRTLRNTYINPLLGMVNFRNHAEGWATDTSGTPPVGLFEDDLQRPLTLFLEVRTPMRAAWPYLVSQLEVLREHDYLSYRKKMQLKEEKAGIVTRPITIVMIGEEETRRRLSLIDDLKRVTGGIF